MYGFVVKHLFTIRILKTHDGLAILDDKMGFVLK